ncbi:HpsJ family protein [Nostoc sphaeroides]|uniref:Uncharacterized protein n=1 Tax=Nostoc sphaeroides CCNUC1 TaxID=2653204 RepID=A0A5P8VW32_9NOSO|nr:HpsJ family protein [Nostoc sphaeroides]QFS44590.1 hypothetical protein GXM_02065 [Nostoc sphaeroides CCNUC1]
MPETDIRELVEVEFTKLSKSVETIQPLLELINLWRLIGYGLLLLSFLDIIDIFVPPSFMNPNWEFQTIGRLVNQVAVPLMGILFVFSGKLAKRGKWEPRILALLSRLTLLIGLLFILLVPLGIVNTIRLYNSNIDQFNRDYNQKVTQANQVEQQFSQASPTDIDNFFKRQGRSIDGKNPEELKKQILSELTQAKQQLKKQTELNKSSTTLALFKNSVKWNLGSLISAALFISIWKETLWARKH